jgi:predicted nucleotide-binding protein (sugar kinase/HSP70/actin superfamily)
MAGKLYLELELDDHTADAGVNTRCEAFFDSLSAQKVQGMGNV